MYIDTHTHINFKAFRDDADKIIQESLSEDTWMVIVGTNYKTSKNALKYANKYEKGVYATVGLHPIHIFEIKAKDSDYEFVSRSEEFNYEAYEKLAKFEKIVAIGEIGLDYYHIDKTKDVQMIKNEQKRVFWEQLLLARRLDKPVIIHCRQAHDDMVELICRFKSEYRELMPKNKPWGVMHCFSGDEDLAWKYFNFGLIISFTGLITFSRQWDELIRKVPSDRLMIETDCPYMTPEPHRGKRNKPIYVKHVAEKIADIKFINVDKVAELTTMNAKRLFNLR